MKMKLVIVTLISIMIVLLFSSCSLGGLHKMWNRFNDSDQTVANAHLDKVLSAIQKKDKAALRKMFSKKAIDKDKNFDKSIDELFDFFQGKVLSYDGWGGPGASGGINEDGSGRDWKSLESTYDVITSKQKYRIAIEDFIQDTADKNNVGIWSVYIINAKDDPDYPELAYWGNDRWGSGIVIDGKKQ